MKNKVVYRGQTNDGKEYLIRYPQDEDAPAMTEYINALSQERTFIRFQGEKITLKSESEYLKGQLEKIQKKQTIQLLVICNGKVVGISAVDLRDKTEKHEGVLGISLLKGFRNQGIGKIFLNLVLEEAKKNLPNLHIITLEVFANNPIAQEMYKKFGFKEFGMLPEGIIYKNSYIDRIYMYKKVR